MFFFSNQGGISLSQLNELKLNRFVKKYTGCKAPETTTHEDTDDSRTNDSGNDTLHESNAGTSIVTSTPKKSKAKILTPKKEESKTSNSDNPCKLNEVSKVISKHTTRMFYQNVNSINSDKKMKDFNPKFVCSYDIILFTETCVPKQKPLQHNLDIFNEKFKIYPHNFKNKKSGCGVLVAVSAELTSERVNLEGYDQLEYVCVQLVNYQESIFIYCAYIPNDSTPKLYETYLNAVNAIPLSEKDTLKPRMI